MDLGGGDLFGGGDPVVAGSPESAKAHQESYLRHGGPPGDGSGRRPGCLRILITLVVAIAVLALVVWGLGEILKLIN